MKTTLSLAILFSFTLSLAQDGFLFRNIYAPNSIYEQVTETQTTSTIEYSGAEDQIEKMKADGAPGTFNISSYTKIIYDITTGEEGSDGFYRYTGKYRGIEIYQDVNGQRIEDKAQEILKNLELHARLKSNKGLEIKDVEYIGIADSLKPVVTPLIKRCIAVVDFPDSLLGVGDSFEDSTKVEFPMKGYKDINLEVVSTLTLDKVENSIASFLVSLSFHVQPFNRSGISVVFKGEGSGELQHNLKTNMIEETSMEMDMNVIVEAKKAALTFISNVFQKVTQEIIRSGF